MNTIVRLPELEDLNRDGTISAAERAISTLILAAGVWILLQLLYTSACLLLGIDLLPAWQFWLRAWAPLSILLVTIAATCLYTWRQLEYEKQEHHDRIDRDHRRERERWELDQLRGTIDREPGTHYTQADIDAAARLIMERYYSGKTWSRDACIAIGLKKEIWDRTNALLKKRRIRIGNRKRLEPADFAEAWGIYVDAAMANSQHIRHYDSLLDAR